MILPGMPPANGASFPRERPRRCAPCSGFPPEPFPVGPRDTILLRVLATADLHGALLPRAGSLSGRADRRRCRTRGLMDSLAADCACPTLRLDAGDAMQGTVGANVTRGRAMVRCSTVSASRPPRSAEHDFEWSLDTLRRRMSRGALRLAGGERVRFGHWPAARLDRAVSHGADAGGLKVAVVGYITADAKTSCQAGADRRASLRRRGARHPRCADRGPRPAARPYGAAGPRRRACAGPVCTGEAIRSGRCGRVAHHGSAHRRPHAPSGEHPGGRSRDRRAGSRRKLAGGGRPGEDPGRWPGGENPDRAGEHRPGDGRTRKWRRWSESYRRRADSITSRVVATVKFPLTRAGDQYPLGGMIAEARRNVLRADVGFVEQHAASGPTCRPARSPTASCSGCSRRRTVWSR